MHDAEDGQITFLMRTTSTSKRDPGSKEHVDNVFQMESRHPSAPTTFALCTHKSKFHDTRIIGTGREAAADLVAFPVPWADSSPVAYPAPVAS